MKTKLLKKVRKEYEIWFYPADCVNKYMKNLDTYILMISETRFPIAFRRLKNYRSEKECIDILKGVLLETVKNDYPGLGSKRHKKANKPRKVWP